MVCCVVPDLELRHCFLCAGNGFKGISEAREGGAEKAHYLNEAVIVHGGFPPVG